MGWLTKVAQIDEIELHVAAAMFIESGLTAECWSSASTKERALLLAARRFANVDARAAQLEEAGKTDEAALVLAEIDGGVAAARLMAQQAGRAVAAERAAVRAREAG